MCRHEYIFTSYSKICKQCGSTERIFLLDTFCLNSAPLNRGYSRRNRWKTKVDKILGLNSGPKYEDPIWKYLHERKATLNTPFDVRVCLRDSPLKLKYYDNIRVFCDIFTSYKVSYTQEKTRIQLIRLFDRLFSDWYNSREAKFFSYVWTMRHFLEQLESPLVVYLKPPTCKRRHSKYIEKLNLIRLQSNYGIRHYETPETRLLSE